MNKLREAVRLALNTNMSYRNIGSILNMSHNSISRYDRIIKEKELSWEKIDNMDDTSIESLLKTTRGRISALRMPDWSYIHQERQQPDMTLQLLWEEYRVDNPGDAYSYSQFTHYYREFVNKLDLSMRQTHRAGECLFVDFAGRIVPYANEGEELTAQIFVGVLGCSNYTFAYAVESQSLPNWIDAHNQMYRFLGGLPEVIVPDNLKSAVTKAGRDPVINRTYLDQARHYGVVIIPARVRRPQDKSKAELGVQIVSRWILARLRHQKFFSIEEINTAISVLLKGLNEKPFKKLPGCRRSRFEEMDKPRLRPLPETPYEYAVWTAEQKVTPDYHVRVNGHYYSVPYQLVTSKVEARSTHKIVEIFHRGKRVASHQLQSEIGEHSTLPEHMPKSHQQYADQTPEKMLVWAKGVGSATEAFVEHQFERFPYLLPGLQSCSSLQRLGKDYGPERLEAACHRAMKIGSLTIKSVRSILQRRLDAMSDENVPVQGNLPLHYNVRGSSYYSS